MNEAIIPAVVAVSGGSALAATIAVYEARAEAAMRASRVRLGLIFPTGTDPLHAKVALSGIAGGSDRIEYVFEVSASEQGVTHHLLVPASVRASVMATLTGALPGLRVAEVPAPSGRATLAATVFVPTPSVLSTENAEGATRTFIAGIAGLSPGEYAAVKWAIRPGTPRRFDPKEPLDRAGRDAERAWRHKIAGSPGFQATGLVVVRADSVARARQILEHLTTSPGNSGGSVRGR